MRRLIVTIPDDPGRKAASELTQRLDEELRPDGIESLVIIGATTAFLVDQAPTSATTVRRLIGPAHAHQDAPCTDACYETMIVDTTVYGEGTLVKVRRALAKSLGEFTESHVITNIITDLQNAGILFRERTPE